MAWLPIANIPPQYHYQGEPASGFVLKFYRAGGAVNIPLATDNTGGTTASDVVLNAEGFPEISGSVIIPHLEESYKVALYATQSAADADSGAIWNPDNLTPPVNSVNSVDELVKVSSNDTTADTLDSKVTSGTNITVTEVGDGGNESLSVNLNSTISGAHTFSNDVTVSGDVTVDNLITAGNVDGRDVSADGAKLDGLVITGSYTPTITLGTGTATFNVSNNTIYYTKIDTLVFVVGTLRIGSVSTPSGTVQISLPYVVDSSAVPLPQAAWGLNTTYWAYDILTFGGGSGQLYGNLRGTTYDSTGVNAVGDLLQVDSYIAINYVYTTT